MGTGPLPIGWMCWKEERSRRRCLALSFGLRYDRRPGIPRIRSVATFFVVGTAELRPGEMRVVEASDKKILLLRTVDGQWGAFSSTCPHAGAPLEKGALCGTLLICPWHKSCFAASDGAVLEPPSLESLQSYFLEISEDEIRIDLDRTTQKTHGPNCGKVNSRSDQTFAILGGGAAAAAAARELRALGFAGRLVMVSQEQRPPYDRTLLSKMYLSGQADSSQLPLRPETLLADCQVDFMVAEIDCVDAEKRTIRFKNGIPSLRYDNALVATGGKPKSVPLPDSESQALVLRNVEDADRLIAAAERAKTAVLIGASFISMEVASAFRERGLAVTIVSRERIPLVKQLGPQMGQLLLGKHLEKGVQFLPELEVLEIASEGLASNVRLTNGQELHTDLVVSGIGIVPATDFLKHVPRNEDQSLSVDAFMRVLGVESMFAAGDLVNFPLPGRNRQRTRVEHWRVAQQQAKIAAASMMGLEQPYEGIPYFWTYHYGVRYEFFGRIPEQFELFVDGDLEQPKFIATYLADGRCDAIFAANRESETAHLLDYMEREGPPSLQTFKAILDQP
jgi:NADPH-dependent 2,4-dienoyl-CoA reductase/sulfur reductase-like enzyme/nitrite reductase/ring-hydroxylating ferredoxin subunit